MTLHDATQKTLWLLIGGRCFNGQISEGSARVSSFAPPEITGRLYGSETGSMSYVIYGKAYGSSSHALTRRAPCVK
jgi:hypothetical protein